MLNEIVRFGKLKNNKKEPMENKIPSSVPILKKKNLKRTMPLPHLPLIPPSVPKCELCKKNIISRILHSAEIETKICEECFNEYILDINRMGKSKL
jgi:hypothetical protein